MCQYPIKPKLWRIKANKEGGKTNVTPYITPRCLSLSIPNLQVY